jgi:hypothetical protein
VALQADFRANIVNKVTGAASQVSADAIDLDVPSIVRLNLDVSSLASMVRDGDDVVLRLVDGREIRIADFYVQGAGAGSDVVLEGQDGKRWLAQLTENGARYSLIDDSEDLVAAAGGSGGGMLAGSGLLALLGGVALAGGIAAAAGTGGGSDSDSDSGSGTAGTPPDKTPPSRPTVGFNTGGTAVTGTGEAGASVEVRGSNGEVVGRGTVGADGSFSVPVTPPRTNGETVTVVQTDTAGNGSPPASATAPDLTAPSAPTATASPDGASVTGTGEPGATVTVTDATGTTLGSAIVAADGSYTVPLSPAQANGGTLTVVQADTAGNDSPAVVVTAPDITAPGAPTAAIDATGASVTGTGEPGATVTVTDAAGTTLGSAIVAADRSYTVPLSPAQANGGTLTVVQADTAGNDSPAVVVTAPDITAPGAPSAAIDATGETVTGRGEPGATVTVTGSGGVVLGSAEAGADGSYTIPLPTPLQNGEMLEVVQADASGNVSPAAPLTAPDLVAPAAPTATLAADGGSVTGAGEPGAEVSVTAADGTVLGSATVAGDGSYTAVLTPAQINSQTISVIQTDAAGNDSPEITLVAPDLTAPAVPVAAIDATGSVVTGTGEPGATVTVSDDAGVVLATGVVNTAGNFAVILPSAQTDSQTISVVQTDAAGNDSPDVTLIAPDLTAPAATNATVAADGASATGIGEAGATVVVTDPLGAEIGRTVVAGDGSYTVVLTPPQTNGETLSVTQADAAGNVSAPTSATAPDLVANDSPDAPSAMLSADGASVTGIAASGNTVTVTGAGGVVLGTGVATADGSYTVLLTAPQRNGETLQVVQADAEGDRSPPTSLTAPDSTAPAAPTAVLDGTGISVTGTGEAGATVTVAAADGTVLGTAIVAANGSYAAILTSAQVNGEILTATQSDAAGNVSPEITLVAQDITAPAAPVATLSSDGTQLTGTGEPGTSVTVTDDEGQVIGTGAVGIDGTFTVPVAPAQTNGEELGVTLTDGSGNVSPATVVTAADTTAPVAPTIVVSGDGTAVAGTGEPGATVTITDPAGAVIGTATVTADGIYASALTTAKVNGELLTATQADTAGNSSPTATALAPDLVAPAAPTAMVSADGTQVSGVGEPGATIVIRDPDGATIGIGQGGPDGGYTVTLTTPQANGELLSVVQSDGGGNISPPVTAQAPDITAPAAPTATVSPDGASVSGAGEAGATVTVRDAAGTVIGIAVVAQDGSYTAPLDPAQANGGTLSVAQFDGAGNPSPTTLAAAPDITAPSAPIANVSADGTSVTGTGEIGATVTVTTPGGTPLGNAVVGADGTFTVPLSPAQANGELVRVTATDTAGNPSPTIVVQAPDITAPGAPTASVAPGGMAVTGIGEPGATVSVTGPDGPLGSVVVAPDGTYTVPLSTPRTNGETLTVVQSDTAGNPSGPTVAVAPDSTAPAVPTATVTADGAAVTGTGVAGATITVTAAGGAELGTTVVGLDGAYTAPLITPQRNGETLGVTQSDNAGNESPRVPIVAPDLTAPPAPTLAVGADGATVSGLGEPGATVTITAAGNVIGTAVVASDGSYFTTLTTPQANGETVTARQADPTGNLSDPATTTAPDITSPAAPTGLAVSADGTTVTGSGEVGAAVTIRDADEAVIGTGFVGAGGTFSVGLATPPVTGATLSATLTDAAGNPSPAATVVAPFDIDAFDNSATANVDLLPVVTPVDYGMANYTLLVSLELLDLEAQLLGTPAVNFTVEPGHRFDATFTFGAALSLGVDSGYSVLVQRFDGTQWVAVTGTGPASLVELALLNGDLVATDSFGPGQYRAFTGFQGTLGAGLDSNLSVTGQDADFTDIGGVVPAAVSGNVNTDPGVGGDVDVVSPQTVIGSVTINGDNTEIVADGTVVDGVYGTLVINRDGSYSYTPDADAGVIGQTEQVTYTLLNPISGEVESATLAIAISSSDVVAAPIAVSDNAVSTVSFENVEVVDAATLEFGFATGGALLLIPATGSGNDTFTVANNTTADVTITAVRSNGLLTVLPTYTITVFNGDGVAIRTVTQTSVADLSVAPGLLGSGVTVTLDDLPAGTYSYTVSSTNTLGTGYSTDVYVGETTTFLDQFVLSGSTDASGSLLDNDTVGTDFPTVRINVGGSFVEIGDAPVSVSGAFGTLTVDEVGNYTYQPSTTLGYSATDLVDSFTYELVQPNGTSSTATLDVTIDVPADDPVAPPLGPTAFADDDVVSLAAFDGHGHDAMLVIADAHPAPDLGTAMLAQPDELGMLLAAYLDQAEPAAAVPGATAPAVAPIEIVTISDPLDYLVLPEDLDRQHTPGALY